MRKYLVILGLEVYALALALAQSLGGVRTDEAKYLLNIPYPHPPLMRSVFHAFEWMPYQELFWRVVLATLLVQSVWFVWSMSRSTPLCALWLTSGALLLQAGSIMVAPVTAVQGLVFVYLLQNAERQKGRNAVEILGFLWLISLFTAYQAILFAPIVAMTFWKMPVKQHQKFVGFFVPIILMVLYVLSNPLALASFVNAGGQNTVLDLTTIVKQAGSAWLYSGSVVLSIVGTVALLRSKNIAMILSFILLIAFLFVSYRSYYAILFLPLFIGGISLHPETFAKQRILVTLQCIVSLYLFGTNLPNTTMSEARKTMQALGELSPDAYILIDGSFGHEWQYESRAPVYRYREELVEGAGEVISNQ